MPETILVLTLEQGFRHQHKVFLEHFVRLVLGRQLVHGAQQGSIYPAVATTPVAVFTVLLLIRSHIVSVTPPQAFFYVEASSATLVATPKIHLQGVITVFRLTCQFVYLHVERHGHLDGINPCPPAIELAIGFLVVGSLHLVVQVGNDVA